METLPPFPDLIDSTILTAFRACERKFFYAFLHKLAPSAKSIHLHFGGAFAKGIETARRSFHVEGKLAEVAVTDGLNAAWDFYGDFDEQYASNAGHAKNQDSLLLALAGYFREWPLGQCGLTPLNGAEGIEYSFAIPVPIRNPSTGSPILYGGRFDMLGQFQSLATICDEKTASSFSSTWASKWHMRNQFLGYTWAARQFGVPVKQVLVRGIAIQKTDIKYLFALSQITEYMMERWYEQLIHDLNRMVAVYESGRFSFDFGDSCDAYGGCEFYSLCTSKIPEEWFGMFARRNWSPLALDPTEGANHNG